MLTSFKSKQYLNNNSIFELKSKFMKNLFFIFAVTVLFQSINAKENSFFVGTKVSNGRFIAFDKNSVINGGGNETYKSKSYYFSNIYTFGGTVKNVSIYSGIGYNLFRSKNNFNSGEIIQPWPILKSANTHLISIPFNVDYNINVYKDKLFILVGAGFEYNIYLSRKYKYQDKTVENIKYKDIEKYLNPHSLVLVTRCGLLYSPNKRVDLFSTFDFGFYATKYLRPREGSTNINYYTLSGSIGLNVKFGKNIKKEKKEKETSLKTTSYKTQQRFLLN